MDEDAEEIIIEASIINDGKIRMALERGDGNIDENHLA